MIAISAILMSVAMVEWQFLIQREKERELIYRGTCIARAIEEYQSGPGRGAPTSFKQLLEAKPPLLRQAYADPMTAEYDDDGKLLPGTGEWTKIQPAQGAPVPQPPGNRPPGGGQPPGGEKEPSGSRRVGGSTPEITPFIGVRSKSDLESIGSYRDIEAGKAYSEWRFMPLTPEANPLRQFEGGIDLLYPPGFGGLRAPGAPPYVPGRPGNPPR